MVEYSEVHEDLGAKCDSLENDVANLEKALANAKTSAEFFKSSLEETNAINECLSESNKRLETDLAAAQDRIKELEDFRGGTIHNSWLTAPREKLIEALQFQGAVTKEFTASCDKIRAEVAASHERERALREAARWALDYIRGDLEPHEYSTTQYINSIKKLQAAIERKEG